MFKISGKSVPNSAVKSTHNTNKKKQSPITPGFIPSYTTIAEWPNSCKNREISESIWDCFPISKIRELDLTSRLHLTDKWNGSILSATLWSLTPSSHYPRKSCFVLFCFVLLMGVVRFVKFVGVFHSLPPEVLLTHWLHNNLSHYRCWSLRFFQLSPCFTAFTYSQAREPIHFLVDPAPNASFSISQTLFFFTVDRTHSTALILLFSF